MQQNKLKELENTVPQSNDTENNRVNKFLLNDINNLCDPEDTISGLKYLKGNELKHESNVTQNITNNTVNIINKKEVISPVKNEETPEKVNKIFKSFLTKIKDLTFGDTKTVDAKKENANIDGNSPMGLMLQIGSASSKLLTSEVLDEKYIKAHKEGYIHIHDEDFLVTGTTTCNQINLEQVFKGGFNTGHGNTREPQDIRTYASLAAIVIQSNQNDQHGGQSIPMFDYYMAPGVLKTFRKLFKSNFKKYLQITLPNKDEKIIDESIENVLKKIGTINSIEIPKEQKDNIRNVICNEFILLRHFFNSRQEGLETADKALEFILSSSIKETNKATFDAMEAFISKVNTMHSRAGAQVPFSSINYGTDTSPEGRMVIKNLLTAIYNGLGNGETAIFPISIFKVKEGINYNPQDPNYDLFQQSIETSAKRLFPNFAFIDAPHNRQYYKEGRPETEIAYMGCRTRVIGNRHGEETVTSRGNLSFTSLNLVRLGLRNMKPFDTPETPQEQQIRINNFFKDVDKYSNLIIEQLIQRYNYQVSKKVFNFPFLMGQATWRGAENLNPEDTLEEVLKQGSLTLGFIGLAECLQALIGEHHGESEKAQELGLKIVQHLRDITDQASDTYDLNIALIATPAEGLSGGFIKRDRELFGNIKGITDRDYYTNSFHVPVYHNTNAFEKIAIEAPYHAMTNGGHISYIEVDGNVTNNLEAFESIVRAMKELGIGYGSINHPIDRDPICGYQGIINDECPQCHRKEEQPIEIIDSKTEQTKLVYSNFNRIRRITGYLVGTLDRFNNAKQAEEKDRVKHI